jgi:hypothetical protein
MKRWLPAALALALVSCTGALAPLLRWEPRPAPESREALVAVGKVTVSRKDARGGFDPGLVGQVRTLTGVPVAVRVDEQVAQTSRVEWAPQPLEATFRTLTAEGLAAAGVGVGQKGDPITARVDVEVTELWVEGYMTMSSLVGLSVTVVNPANGAVRARFFTRQEGSAKDSENLPMFAAMGAHDVTPACRIGEFTVACLALQRALSATLTHVVAGFQQSEVREALLGKDPAPPAPAPPAPAAAGACEPDCSPGYTCLRGVCVSACNPPCPAGERCGADRVCYPSPR